MILRICSGEVFASLPFLTSTFSLISELTQLSFSYLTTAPSVLIVYSVPSFHIKHTPDLAKADTIVLGSLPLYASVVVLGQLTLLLHLPSHHIPSSAYEHPAYLQLPPTSILISSLPSSGSHKSSSTHCF